IDPKEDSAKIKRKIEGLIYEVNETYRYSNHPLISRFVRLHVCAGAPFVLSVKRDRTLRDLIETGPVTINEAVSIAIQIAHALEYCQGRGLSAHQDMKPENVLIDPTSKFNLGADYPLKWVIKICDFGLANAFREFGKFTGSRPYMAPEQYVA